MFRPKPPGPAGLPPVEENAFGQSRPAPKPCATKPAGRGARGNGLRLPWWLAGGWVAAMLGSAFLLRPLNDLIGRQPATIVWLVGVAAATWALWVWLGNGRLDRIEAGPLGAPGRAWGRIHDRFEHVFVALGTFHALLIFAGFLYGIAQTGPVARWIVIAFAVFMAVVVPWAWIAGRREQTARARERAERELAYARRTNTRRLDDFAS